MSTISRSQTRVVGGPGENFLYGFKGAQSAPRAERAAHAEAPREVGT
jgi:hypothetical protein